MSLRAVIRWMICSALLGFTAGSLWFGVSVHAQPQNIVTLYGCLTATSATCTTLQPVAVDSSGNLQVIGQ